MLQSRVCKLCKQDGKGRLCDMHEAFMQRVHKRAFERENMVTLQGPEIMSYIYNLKPIKGHISRKRIDKYQHTDFMSMLLLYNDRSEMVDKALYFTRLIKYKNHTTGMSTNDFINAFNHFQKHEYIIDKNNKKRKNKDFETFIRLCLGSDQDLLVNLTMGLVSIIDADLIEKLEQQFKDWCEQNPEKLDTYMKKYIITRAKNVTLENILGRNLRCICMFPRPKGEYTLDYIIDCLDTYEIQVKDGPGYYV